MNISEACRQAEDNGHTLCSELDTEDSFVVSCRRCDKVLFGCDASIPGTAFTTKHNSKVCVGKKAR